MFDAGGWLTLYPETLKRLNELKELKVIKSTEYPESDFYNLLVRDSTVLYNVSLGTVMNFVDGFWYGKRN